MLTLDDKTLENASVVFDRLKNSRVENFGFKDIGIPYPEMQELAQMIRNAGKKLFLEIVSSSLEATLRGAKRALELKADYLIGGQYVKEVLEVIQGASVQYYPYVGEIIGHPCQLAGTAREMLDEIAEYKKLGVDGINLLAYRYDKNPHELMTDLIKECELPLLIAGSVNSKERIDFLRGIDVEYFTMGTALFLNELVETESLEDQLNALENFSF
jgi:hypothetical protein